MMARTRQTLHQKLCEVLGEDLKDHCYYDPPARMKFPCIRYENSKDEILYGDNKRYKLEREWTITIIDPDPDSKIPAKLMETFDYCTKDREFAADGLHHFIYTLYY